MNNLTKILIIFFFLSSFNLKAFDNIYRIQVEDINANILSAGTGFLVEEDGNKYIVTSFHVLNSNLIKANKIKALKDNGEYYNLEISFYDDLLDILILRPFNNYIYEEGLSFSADECHETTVVGYNQNKKYALETGALKNVPERNKLKKISKYLKNGFSGAPVLNQKAQICGMVVLSSERNSNSIALSKESIEEVFLSLDTNSRKTISMLRKELNIEHDVFSKNDLDKLLREVLPGKQIVINIKNDISDIELFDVSNIVFKSDDKIFVKQFSFNESSNVLLENLKVGKIVLKKVNNFSMTFCDLIMDDSLKIVESSNLSFLNNEFLSERPSVSLFYSDFNYKMLSYNKSKNPIEVKIN